MGKGSSSVARRVVGLLRPSTKSPAQEVYEKEFMYTMGFTDRPGDIVNTVESAVTDIRDSAAELAGFTATLDLLARISREHVPTFHALAGETLFVSLCAEAALTVQRDPGRHEELPPRIRGRITYEAFAGKVATAYGDRLRPLLGALITVDGLESRLLPAKRLPSYRRALIGYARALLDLIGDPEWSRVADDRTAIEEFFSAPITPALRGRFWRRFAWESITEYEDMRALPTDVSGDRADREERMQARLLSDLIDIVSERHLGEDPVAAAADAAEVAPVAAHPGGPDPDLMGS